MGRGGTALGIIGIILAAGAIGFAFFIWNGQNSTISDLNTGIDDLQDQINDMETPSNTSTSTDLNQSTIVGVWESFSRNTDYSPYTTNENWLLELTYNQIINPEYLSVSNSNTRINILKSGWYRIHISGVLSGLTNNAVYTIRFYRNGILIATDPYLVANAEIYTYNHIAGTVLIECTAGDYINLNAYSQTDDNDDFNAYTNVYNHLSIEYLTE